MRSPPEPSDTPEPSAVPINHDNTPAAGMVGQPGQQPAVVVQGLYKSYGMGGSKLFVLRDMDMVVPKGAIYGLLGPSGCGKTTLLRCILGRLLLNAGKVTTLGKKPGTLGHGVPGHRVGYMPQDLALFQKLTIGETLFYFGRIFNKSRAYIKRRIKFLVEFLDLPEESKVIEKLSGGQMRRTSFAVALLHEPELLVLDEPTVGVDPLLRQRIWDHMLSIVAKSSTTIIITTHYVEEARQAHVVGLMRGGRLLAESAPGPLLEYHQVQSLETVFLKLCVEDQDDADQVDDVSACAPVRVSHGRKIWRSVEYGDEESAGLLQNQEVQQPDKMSCGRKCWAYLPSGWNIWALVIKNFTFLSRNLPFLLFEFLLPTIQVCLFCLCIGGQPFGLRLGVVNHDTAFLSASKMFLQHLDNKTIIQVPYENTSDAYGDVKSGLNWGFILFGANYTQDLIERYTSRREISNRTVEGSNIHTYLDMTNQEISLTIQTALLTAFQTFAQQILKQIEKNPAMAELPIVIEEPVYGDRNPTFTNFMAPGIIISITVFMASGLTAMSFVMEKKQGLLDRSFVAGVNSFEVMAAQVLTQLVVMTVQVLLMLVFALAVFKVPYEGPLILVILLTLFVGFSGMALGLLISCVCDEENTAIMMVLGTLYPTLILNGIIWPIEAMPMVLQYISVCLPLTYPTEAMRSLLARGWDLTYLSVWRGFLMTIGWGWGLLALSALVLKLKRA